MRLYNGILNLLLTRSNAHTYTRRTNDKPKYKQE